MIDFKEVIDGEQWELFARDFMMEMKFIIDVPPGRGADGGRDMSAVENLEGKLGQYEMRWLLSCKNNAVADTSVGVSNEQNITDRMKKFGATGFIGFYSTLASSGLIDTLTRLREKGEISDYIIFDNRLIEAKLVEKGFSQMLLRYFPESYKKIKPLQSIMDKYYPLECDHCGKDMLEELNLEMTLMAVVEKYDSESSVGHVVDIYCAHKGECDRTLEAKANKQGLITGWNDLSDLTTPLFYLKFLFGIMNSIRKGNQTFSDEAYKKLMIFIMAISQKVLREITDEERERLKEIMEFPFF